MPRSVDESHALRKSSRSRGSVHRQRSHVGVTKKRRSKMKTLEIRLAQSASELDSVFRLRHEVLANYMTPHADQRIYDRFDAFPVSRNIIAVYDGVIVGGTRLTEKT